MFLGHTLLNILGLSSIIDVFKDKLPPGPEDPPGIFDKPFKDYYDYIVVGSGSAGSIVATRLSEDPVSVLLLEAGGSDLDTEFAMIPGAMGRLQRSYQDWKYKSVPQKTSSFAVKDQIVYLPGGKMLGGSSSINSMGFVRGSRRDYDEWEEEGCTGWSYNKILRYFKKLENIEIPHLRNSVYRGTDGPITVTRGTTTPLGYFHQQAAHELGYKTVDCNGYDQTGFCVHQANIKDGLRCSTASCYLRPALNRTNLQVSINSHVSRVLVNNTYTYGVEVIKNGIKSTILAGKEVILSAGTIGSSQILLLSGIGPSKHLNDMKISVVADLPVGRGLQDHDFVVLAYTTNVTLNVNSRKMDSPETIMDYVLNRRGIYARTMLDGYIFDRLDSQSTKKYPDIQLGFGAGSYEKGAVLGYLDMKQVVIDEHLKRVTSSGFSIAPFSLHPHSRGYIELRTRNPMDPPNINPKYLSDPRDMEFLIKVIRWLQKLEKTKAWRSIDAKLIRYDVIGHCVDIIYNTDDYWRCIVRNFATSALHLTSTCRMGSVGDPTAVVDPSLRVIGIRNLRVVDASVMRNVPSGNTNAPTMMIAEKAADMIKQSRKTGYSSFLNLNT